MYPTRCILFFCLPLFNQPFSKDRPPAGEPLPTLSVSTTNDSSRSFRSLWLELFFCANRNQFFAQTVLISSEHLRRSPLRANELSVCRTLRFLPSTVPRHHHVSHDSCVHDVHIVEHGETRCLQSAVYDRGIFFPTGEEACGFTFVLRLTIGQTCSDSLPISSRRVVVRTSCKKPLTRGSD